MEVRNEAFCILGKIGRPNLQIDIFRRRFYELNFLHLLISRRARKLLTRHFLLVTSNNLLPKCVLDSMCPPSLKTHIYTPPSVQFNRSFVSDSLWPHGLQHTRLPYPSPTPGACSNSCPSSRWRHLTISFSLVPFPSCLQSFPASGSFPMSQFSSGGQSIGASASASVLPMNSQDWFPLEWTGWISLLSKGLSRVFTNTTVRKHQFFGTQPSLWSNSHINTGYWKNHSFD